jgi:hypothetical protein
MIEQSDISTEFFENHSVGSKAIKNIHTSTEPSSSESVNYGAMIQHITQISI